MQNNKFFDPGSGIRKPEETEYINWAIVCKSSFEDYLEVLREIENLPIRLIYKQKSLGKLWICREGNGNAK